MQMGMITGGAAAVQATKFTTLGTNLTSYNGGRGVAGRSALLSGGVNYRSARANLAVTAGGKFAWRCLVTFGRYTDGSPLYTFVGVGNASATLTGSVGSDANGWSFGSEASAGNVKFYNGTTTSVSSTLLTSGDYIDVAVDLAAGNIWWGINGSWLASGNPATGANPMFTGLTGTLYPMVSMSGNGSVYLNPDEAMTLPSGFAPLP